MGELLTRIISIIENLLVLPLIWLFPLKWSVVIPGSSAIRFTLGLPGSDLGPGIHFGTTGQTFQKKHVNNLLAVAESMYVLTEDGVSIRIRGVAIYGIELLAKYMTATDDSDEFVIEACEAAIKNAVSHVPYQDLVSDSDTVEEAIRTKITETCGELGINVKRYRFQDIELTDPICRGLSSIGAMEPNLTASVQKMINSFDDPKSISYQDALAALSPNIRFVANMTPKPLEYDSNQENEYDSEKIPKTSS